MTTENKYIEVYLHGNDGVVVHHFPLKNHRWKWRRWGGWFFSGGMMVLDIVETKLSGFDEVKHSSIASFPAYRVCYVKDIS